MSKNIQSLSTLVVGSALALSLSACTITPVNPDSRVGQATEKLTAAGSTLWEKTRHVLRLDGTDAYNGQPAVATADTNDEFHNEVDLALLQQGQDEAGTVIGADGQLVVLSPVADNDGIVNTTPQNTDIVITENAAQLQPANTQNLGSEVIVVQPEQPAVVAQATTQAPAPAAAAPAAIALPDYEHVVADNETLWDLSKRLTGDATNWKVLAELNNLGPNGAVFPGNTLIIPADMLKDPSRVQVIAAESSENTQPVIEETVEVAGTERVRIPEQDAVAAVTEIVVAEADAPLPAYDGPKTAFGVQASETLWDLAKRTTGDATNWKAIAAANGMTEKEATFIKYGQTIDVPDELLKSSAGAVAATTETQSAPSTESDATPVLAAAQPVVDEKVERPVIDVTASTDAATTSEEELTIIPTTFKSEPLVVEETAVENAETAAAASPANAQTIMVSGTYYPKAVYNDANFSASLLMRVSPGTELQVIRSLGPWFEVRTEQGIGFVHSRDIK